MKHVLAGRPVLAAALAAVLRTSPVALLPLAAVFVTNPAWAAAPTISSFSPGAGPIGSKVVILGTGFTGASAVTLGGTAAVFVVNSATQVTATLPATASGKITVKTVGGTATSTAAYTVVPGVQAIAAEGHPQLAITATGSGFNPYSSVDVYFDTADIALGVSNGSGVVTASITVPATASPGAHWITMDQRSNHMAGQGLFTVRTDWSMGGMGYNSRYTNPWEATLSASTVPSLETQFSVPDGVFGNATPLIDVNNIIYAGDVQGIVRAYTSKGVLAWTASTGVSLSPISPAATLSYVFFGGGTKVFAYKLMCANGGGTCTPAWTADIGTNVSAGLTLFNNTLYVPGADGAVHTVNPVTGAVGASITNVFGTTGAITTPASFGQDGTIFYGIGDDFETAHPNGNASQFTSNNVVSGVAVNGGLGYYTSADGYLHQSGGSEWTTTIPSGCASVPAVANGLVYVSTCGTVAAYRTDTGGLYWSVTVPSGDYTSGGVTVANGVVYACVNAAIDAYIASYGEFLWSGGVCNGPPIVTNGTVYGAYAQIMALSPNGAAPSVMRARPVPATLHPVPGLVAQVTPDR